jgi:signal transduction histidine kinase
VRTREEFLTVASHELNTPTAALILSLEALKHAPRSLGFERQHLLELATLAHRQGRRLARIIRELLDTTAIEHGALALDPQPVALDEVVARAMAELQPDLARAGCEIGLALDPSVRGRWDPRHLEQIVIHLVSNAMKFGGGRPIEVRSGRAGSEAWLTVADHGVGIEPAARDRIFDRFDRGLAGQHQGGLGLGLYLCRRLVELHGGTISVESEPGGGATFRVTLPGVESGESAVAVRPSALFQPRVVGGMHRRDAKDDKRPR